MRNPHDKDKAPAEHAAFVAGVTAGLECVRAHTNDDYTYDGETERCEKVVDWYAVEREAAECAQ